MSWPPIRTRPVVGWIERCNHPNPPEQGEWLPDDGLAPTLREVLGVMGNDAAPILVEQLAAFDRWAESGPNEDEPLPCVVGRIESSLRGRPVERMAHSYGAWLVQRVLDDYRALDAGDKT